MKFFIAFDINPTHYFKNIDDLTDIAIFRYGFTSNYDMNFFDMKAPHLKMYDQALWCQCKSGNVSPLT